SRLVVMSAVVPRLDVPVRMAEAGQNAVSTVLVKLADVGLEEHGGGGGGNGPRLRVGMQDHDQGHWVDRNHGIGHGALCPVVVVRIARAPDACQPCAEEPHWSVADREDVEAGDLTEPEAKAAYRALGGGDGPDAIAARLPWCFALHELRV